MNDNYKMLLEVSEKDIKDYKHVLEKISNYDMYRKELVNNLYIRMKANNLSEFGGVKIVKEPNISSIEIGKVLDYILNDELAKAIVVKVDIEQTKKNLIETYGFTNVVIEPLVELLKQKLGTMEERLVVNENTSNHKR